MATRTCRKCGFTIVLIAGAWVVIDPATTADGLSYCPPDPDTLGRIGNHQPRKEK